MGGITSGISSLLTLLLAALVCAEGQVQLLPISSAEPGREVTVRQLMASARVALDHGDLEAGRSNLEKVLSREETNRPARLALTDVLRRMRRWNEAENHAQTLISQFPADTEPVYLLAEIEMQRGNPQAAQRLASRCLAQGDSRPEVYKVLAVSEYLLQNNDKFLADIRAVIDKNPLDPEAQYMLARYLYETKQYRQSLSALQAVLGIQPAHYKAHYYAGLVYQANGDTDHAQSEFVAAIGIIESKDIHYAWPFADLGRALNDEGKTDKAIEWISRGIRNDPACPKTYYEYARTLFRRSAGSEVKRALIEAVRLDPGYSDAYYLLARYYRKTGENQAADQVLAKFRDLKAHPVPSPYGLPRQ
jgi:predicted Zn-dependent protease